MKMEIKELANIIYDTLFDNKEFPQFPCADISEQQIDSYRNNPIITFAYEGLIYDLELKQSQLNFCRWCSKIFDPAESGHKHLCSDDCFNEEQSCQ